MITVHCCTHYLRSSMSQRVYYMRSLMVAVNADCQLHSISGKHAPLPVVKEKTIMLSRVSIYTNTKVSSAYIIAGFSVGTAKQTDRQTEDCQK